MEVQLRTAYLKVLSSFSTYRLQVRRRVEEERELSRIRHRGGSYQGSSAWATLAAKGTEREP